MPDTLVPFSNQSLKPGEPLYGVGPGCVWPTAWHKLQWLLARADKAVVQSPQLVDYEARHFMDRARALFAAVNAEALGVAMRDPDFAALVQPFAPLVAA